MFLDTRQLPVKHHRIARYTEFRKLKSRRCKRDHGSRPRRDGPRLPILSPRRNVNRDVSKQRLETDRDYRYTYACYYWFDCYTVLRCAESSISPT